MFIEETFLISNFPSNMATDENKFILYLVGNAHLRWHLGAVGHLVTRLLAEVTRDDHLEIHFPVRLVVYRVEIYV